MSNKHGSARQIHSRPLVLIGDEACLQMLEVASDLRSGFIPPELYDQSTLGRGCGTACCVLGHLEHRMGGESEAFRKIDEGADEGLADLFSAMHPSDPQLAADAIERFVFDGSVEPWKEGGL